MKTLKMQQFTASFLKNPAVLHSGKMYRCCAFECSFNELARHIITCSPQGRVPVWKGQQATAGCEPRNERVEHTRMHDQTQS